MRCLLAGSQTTTSSALPASMLLVCARSASGNVCVCVKKSSGFDEAYGILELDYSTNVCARTCTQVIMIEDRDKAIVEELDILDTEVCFS
jgi:hypothetical protein